MRYLSIVVVLLLAVLTGCQSAPQVENPYPLTAGEYDAMFEAAADALQAEGFTIDRRDYRFGQILSDPLVAATMFEP